VQPTDNVMPTPNHAPAELLLPMLTKGTTKATPQLPLALLLD